MSTRAAQEGQLGREEYSRGRISAARRHFVEAIRLDPNQAEFHYGLALCDWTEGQMAAAGERLHMAVRLNAGLAIAQSLLGEWYLHQGMIDAALKSTERALALDSDNATFLQSRAWALEAAGETDAAWKIVKQLIAGRSPMNPPLARLYGRLAVNYGEGDQALQAIMELLRAGAAPNDSLLLLTACELLERAGRYDEAFAMAERANAIYRGRPYDLAVAENWAKRVVDYFTPERIRSLPKATVRNEKPVFIVGMPRSGTSLVEQIAASHPAVHGAGELDFMHRVLNGTVGMLGSSTENYPACLDRLTTEIADGMADIYLGPLTALKPGAARITDKMPLNWFHLGLIALLFPGARVIHCRRDPMDTCLSCFMTHFNQGHEYKHNLSHLGHFFRIYARMMAHWRSAIDLPMLEVVYEEVVADAEAQSRRLIEFLGLPWDDRCLTPHSTRRAVVTASVQQVRRPIYTTSVQRWRRYEKQLDPLKAALREN
jgi:tetratricopeptide (TPR) repeat protein